MAPRSISNSNYNGLTGIWFTETANMKDIRDEIWVDSVVFSERKIFLPKAKWVQEG